MRGDLSIVLASKVEGADYRDMDIFVYEKGVIERLSGEGYKIFFGFEGTFVIDNIISKKNFRNQGGGGMNNEEHNEREEEVEIDFEFTALPGEIVEVDGYDGFFKVDCQHVDVERYANEKFTEVYYDVINIHTDEWVVACDEDLTLVADAAAADDFIANMGPKKARKFDAMDITIYQFEDKGAINMAGKNERKLTPREQSNKEAADKKAARKKRKEYVDRALDGRYNAKELTKVFPDDKAKYERRIARYDRFLAKVNF